MRKKKERKKERKKTEEVWRDEDAGAVEARVRRTRGVVDFAHCSRPRGSTLTHSRRHVADLVHLRNGRKKDQQQNMTTNNEQQQPTKNTTNIALIVKVTSLRGAVGVAAPKWVAIAILSRGVAQLGH